jgi:structural maintenance of chromosome 1
MSELRELSNKKPRGKADENLITEMTRLELAIALAKDSLVSCSTTTSIQFIHRTRVS